MDRPDYTALELHVMHLMAHGYSRESISRKMGLSPSTVARIARAATDKAVPAPEMNAPIIHGISVMVAQGRISVRFADQKSTARETALAFLEKKIMSCLDWREFEELRAVYTAMRAEQKGSRRG